MDVVKINDKDTLYTFYGIGDLVEFAAESNPFGDRAESRSKSPSDIEWSGGTYEDAEEQALTGNPKLVQSFYDGVESLNAMIEQDANAFMRDVTGEFFDVGDFLAGEPECWWREDESQGKHPVVPLYVATTMSSAITTKMIQNRGCAVVALCDMLQKHGFIVDLNVVGGSVIGDNKLYVKVNVKTDPVDLDMLAFLVANPLFLRRLEFSLTEIWQNNPSPDHGCYGKPCDYDLPDIFNTGVSGFYFTTSRNEVFSTSNYDTLEHAKNHVLSMIQEFSKDEKQVILG